MNLTAEQVEAWRERWRERYHMAQEPIALKAWLELNEIAHLALQALRGGEPKLHLTEQLLDIAAGKESRLAHIYKVAAEAARALEACHAANDDLLSKRASVFEQCAAICEAEGRRLRSLKGLVEASDRELEACRATAISLADAILALAERKEQV